MRGNEQTKAKFCEAVVHLQYYFSEFKFSHFSFSFLAIWHTRHSNSWFHQTKKKPKCHGNVCSINESMHKKNVRILI